MIRPEHIQFELANEATQAPAAAAASLATSAEEIRSLAGSLVQAERDLMLDALRTHQGSRREAAERLGISPRTLRYKLARLREAGIDVPAA